MDFRPKFAEFCIFSGPCDGHTDLPSRKNMDGHKRIWWHKKSTDRHGLQNGIPWQSRIRYFQFLLLHHAGLFENLGEDKSGFMTRVREVKFSEHISFSFDAMQHESRQVDKFVPNYVQYVLMWTFLSRRFGSGCGFCCPIFSILFICIQDKIVHIGKYWFEISNDFLGGGGCCCCC